MKLTYSQQNTLGVLYRFGTSGVRIEDDTMQDIAWFETRGWCTTQFAASNDYGRYATITEKGERAFEELRKDDVEPVYLYRIWRQDDNANIPVGEVVQVIVAAASKQNAVSVLRKPFLWHRLTTNTTEEITIGTAEKWGEPELIGVALQQYIGIVMFLRKD